MSKNLDGWCKNLSVIREDISDWRDDMGWNAKRLRDAVRERSYLRIPHYIHAFVTTTIEKLYRVWGIAFWVWLALAIMPGNTH